MSKWTWVKALIMGLGLSVALAGAASADAVAETKDRAPAVQVMVNGEQMSFTDGLPYLDAQTERVYIPLRSVAEILGVKVDWADGTVFIERPTMESGAEAAVTITEKLVQSVTDEAEVNMRIPVLAGLPDAALEKELNAEFLAKAEDFRQEVLESVDEYQESMAETGGTAHAYQVAVDYEEHYNRDGLLSISVSYYGFTGGAHGFTVKETLNLDVNAGARLTMADFFGPDEDYEDIVVREIQKQISADPEMYFTNEEGLEGIEDARDTVAKIAADQKFYIGDGEIVVYFAQYDIAPYAVGMPEFAIPVSVMPGAAK